MSIEKWLGRSRSGSYRTEQKELLKQYATARYLHNQAKALAEGVSDRARATAIAGWEAGTCKERSAKACNKMKCKTHGEVSGCATQKQADSGKNRCWFVKESHKCGGDVIDPKPCQVRSYDTSVRIMSGVDAFGRIKSRAATDASKRWKKLSEFVNTRDATLCSAMISR
jgi:hypothetical protein